MHENQTLVISQIQVVSDSSVGLSKRTVHLIGAQVGEDHSGSMGVGRRWGRALRRRVECPLQEVNVRSGTSRALGCLLSFLGGLGSGKREDELWVLARGRDDALVCVKRDYGRDGVTILCVAQTPESLDLLGWELADLLDVQVCAERFDGAGVAGDRACDLGGP